jgi:hypothetical protein
MRVYTAILIFITSVVQTILFYIFKVGAIIGRGGDNVKEIQRKTNTRIDFKDDLDDGRFQSH